ncbi:puratrophin-1-like [Babylonia areolata]|uniref:puratrophin-1-like n=1 Tax=Babylonia areolata TaxID=304850 RepID=UPI003FD49820
MDWVSQARGAPDHELPYILRQCLVATEYTVRHLQWEETLQQQQQQQQQRAAGHAPGETTPHRAEHSRHRGHHSPLQGALGALRSCSECGGGGDSSPGQGSHNASSPQRGGSPGSPQQRSPSSCGVQGPGRPGCSGPCGHVTSGSPGQSPAPWGRVRDSGGSDSDSTLVSDGEGFRRTSGDAAGAGAGGHRSCGGSVSDRGVEEGEEEEVVVGVVDAASPQSRLNGDCSPSARLQSPGSVSGTDSNSPNSRVQGSSYYRQRQVAAPQSATDLDHQLLHSGIAILPGSSDVQGRRLIFIFTCSVVWHHRQVVSSELTRLLMYYFSIPRREVVSQGVTIVVDARGATSSTVNILLESLYLFKDNVPNSIAVIHILADRPTQSLVLKSPVYDPQSGVSLDVLLSQDMLQRSVSLEQLPQALDGTYPYSHEEWVRFRMKLEPFLTSCCRVAQFLVGVMQEVASADTLPRSASATRELITRQQNKVKAAFSDPRLLNVQEDGEVIMSSLRREERSCCHSEDYRHAVEKVSGLYQQLQDTMSRLSQLTEERLQRLQQCLQLRGFEEECDKVLTWLQQEGQSLLERHGGSADNLKAARAQQRDFEKLYFSAMTHIEKGNDLMEEAGTLAQSGAFSDDALGYRHGARLLKQQLQLFTSQLEDTRERIEGTARCYSLLDKSYEWALEAMKYVASMRMEHCATPPGLDKLLRSLEHYLQQHPPMTDETFLHMMDTAQRLHNTKLLDQCRVAKARCQETYHLLLLRHNTLQRARDQLVAEHGVQSLTDLVDGSAKDGEEESEKPSQDCSAGGGGGEEDTVVESSGSEAATGGGGGEGGEGEGSSRSVLRSPRAVCQSPPTDLKSVVEEEDQPVWEPRREGGGGEDQGWSHTCSVALSPQLTRADSTQPSSPHTLTDRPTPGTNNSLGTRSPSCSPSPTSPSSRLPSRPTPLPSPGHDKSEFKTPSSRGPTRLQLSRTISQPVGTPVSRSSPLSGPLTAKAGPLKKILKRASTAPGPLVTSPVIPEDGHDSPRSETEMKLVQRGDRTLSMITGSSDSLPSMQEEEEDFPDSSMNNSQSSMDSSQTKWTPVAVNSHLHHSRTSPTGPMADLRLSGKKRTVLLIMSEMVQTERDYTRSLQYVIENYIPELQRVDVPQMLRGKRNVIFGNVEKIYQFHSHYFLRELEACERNPFLVGHYFLRHEPEFHLYTLYNKNKPKSDDLMLELGKQFFRQKQLELGDRMDLASYLLKPVQRMGKYALLLKQILKECPETEPEYADLKAAEEMVRFQLRHGNDLLAMDSLRDVDVNLQEQGKLLRQDEFLVFQGRKKMMRQVFLFEDLILFSKARRGRQGQHDIYVYKHSLKMADIGLTENCGDSGYKFEIWFRRRTLGDNYILQAPNSEVKRAWVKEISRILWHQAIRNRESHINEMASMGIGNKPCMDIKPSSDNINARSLDITVSNKGARTRNSIAVTSVEYLRQSNKRPHSIISVSSNSSSNSSHSSLGLFGSLNLAFDPIDSPRHLHRQSMMSSESGIEVDQGVGEGDPGGGKPRQPQQQSSVTSPTRGFSGVLQPSGVLNQSFTEPIMTDV